MFCSCRQLICRLLNHGTMDSVELLPPARSLRASMAYANVVCGIKQSLKFAAASIRSR